LHRDSRAASVSTGGQWTCHAETKGSGGEGGIRTLGTGISQHNGLAIHRWVLNRLENVQLYSSFQRVRVVLLQGGENFPARCAGAAWPGARTRNARRFLESPHCVSRLPHPLERRRPRHSHPEGSQGRVREAAIIVCPTPEHRRFARRVKNS